MIGAPELPRQRGRGLLCPAMSVEPWKASVLEVLLFALIASTFLGVPVLAWLVADLHHEDRYDLRHGDALDECVRTTYHYGAHARDLLKLLAEFEAQLLGSFDGRALRKFKPDAELTLVFLRHPVTPDVLVNDERGSECRNADSDNRPAMAH